MNKLDFLIKYMPIYINFTFGLMTLITLKRDFITLLILLFLNETIHTQFKNEMIPAFYYWVVPEQDQLTLARKRKSGSIGSKDAYDASRDFFPSFHCQYVWFINSVIFHYVSFYRIGDFFINNVVLLGLGSYVVVHKMNDGKTFIQSMLGVFLGICYGIITTKYILYLEPVWVFFYPDVFI